MHPYRIVTGAIGRNITFPYSALVLMDHNMVLSLSYDYAKRNRRRQRTNARPLQTILMAMVRR
jgi:hypothetical protein